MVGSPKSLLDLRRIDAGVRVTCNACGRTSLLEREKLIDDLLRKRRNLAWGLLPRYFRCSSLACRSKDVALRPEPFAAAETRGNALVDHFVLAAERLIVAMRASGSATPELQEMAAARSGFEAAKRALLDWVAARTGE